MWMPYCFAKNVHESHGAPCKEQSNSSIEIAKFLYYDNETLLGIP